jgi:hypothetical protein
LLEKMTRAEISPEDRAVLHYLLSSIVKSREHINYLLIFVLSLIAIVVDLFMAA